MGLLVSTVFLKLTFYLYCAISPCDEWQLKSSLMLLLVVLGICCCKGFCLVVGKRGCSLAGVHRLHSRASLAGQAWALGVWASIVVAHGLRSCSTGLVAPQHVGVFLDQD